MCYSTLFLAPETISTALDPRYTKIGRRQNSSILSFLAVFVSYSTQFIASETISTALDPGYTKIGRRQNSSISSFLAVFMGYGTQFLPQKTISTARDPGYMKIGESAKLVDLFISSHFWGLKHTIFWLRRRFEWLVTLRT